MAEFSLADPGKFALVAINNVFTDFPDDEAFTYQLSDGTRVCARVPVPIDITWKEWIGKIRLDRLENSNLIMIFSEGSANPHLLDEEHKKLNKRLSQTFSLLQLSGVLEYGGANLLCGSHFSGKSNIRQMSELPFFYQTRGYSRVPVTVQRLEKAVQLRKVLEQEEASTENFQRLKWGWRVLMDGLQKEHGEERIHQFVRSLEALILPEIGHTKGQFAHRCQTFAKAGSQTKQILEEAFDLRSMAEHLNDWDRALEHYPKDEREIVALHRTRQLEKLASFAYSRIFQSDIIRNHFLNETKQGEFWKLPDDNRRSEWGSPFDLTTINEVRVFDSWGRAVENCESN